MYDEENFHGEFSFMSLLGSRLCNVGIVLPAPFRTFGFQDRNGLSNGLYLVGHPGHSNGKMKVDKPQKNEREQKYRRRGAHGANEVSEP